MPDWIGKTIGKVRIDKYLARGGMAEVYLGSHLSLDRQVAIKVLHGYIEEDPGLLARFQREAKVVAGLRHPNIVQIFDFDATEGHPYIVMEYLKGPTLSTYLRNLHNRNERIPPQEVARLLKMLTSALDYAHSQGMIHRDIKPGNIMLHDNQSEGIALDQPLTSDVEAVVTDFGLARIENAASQTASGMVSGTPAYMSPEQARGDKTDGRTDIYSLGAVLYEMLAGRVPFEADTLLSVLYMQINDPPPPIEGISPEVQTVLNRALAKNPDDRYQTCREMALDFFLALDMTAEAETISRPNSSTQQSKTLTRTIEKKPAQNKRAYLPITLGIISVFAILIAGFLIFRTPTLPLGLLRFQDGTARADQIILTTSGMPLPPESSQYEVWLIKDDDEQRVTIGVINFDQENKGTLTFDDPDGKNLIGLYRSLEITIEPKPDNSPNPSTAIAFSAALPIDGLTHVRHLVFSYYSTPDEVGYINGLDTTTKLINDSANAMLTSFQAGDKTDVRLQAEKMLNIISGGRSSDHKDWDGDGSVIDPSDKFGLLLNGENEGYIDGAYKHANLTLTSLEPTENMLTYGKNVTIATKNIEEWTTQLSGLLKTILAAPADSDVGSQVDQAVALANQIRNGIDINNNEIIEPIVGESGAVTAYQNAYYMAGIEIFP